MPIILPFNKISKKDVSLVGGKNASLGEMVQRLSKQGISIPDGFALTSKAYWYYLKANKIDKKLKEIFAKFNPKDLKSLQESGREARSLILKAEFPQDLEREIIKYYKKLSQGSIKRGPTPFNETGSDPVSSGIEVAVRSSATAEDLPSASFAGQHESYLRVKGEKELLETCKKCMASLFTDRAIAYREEKGFNHLKIALSVGVQKMVRSDLASAGVMFTLDTETGFSNVVLINSVFGVGEKLVKGRVIPDEFYVFKPTLEQGYRPIIVKNLSPGQKKFSLTDEEILTLARWACLIEKHYKTPQDIEWAKDGKTKELFIVQSRPETVHAVQGTSSYQEYKIKTRQKPILTGIAIGDKIGQGKVRVISDVSKMNQFQKSEVLVAKMTDPDWLPIMRLASAIITDQGSKTAHAAIVSRELGIPAIVGARNASKVLKTGQVVTVDCTKGLDGRVFEGRVLFESKKYDLRKIPKIKTKLLVNIAAPEMAFKTSFLPVDGVGLAREEFIIAEKIKIHPLALYHFNKIKDKKLKNQITKITVEHKDKKEYFIEELAEGIGQIASAFWPREVIVRFSDFKTNEYRNLIGGQLFEGEESNPMLGFRGASRYLDKEFQPAFRMECQAIKRVREVFGLKNISVMVPFCRTAEEGKKVVELIKRFGLKRSDFKIYVMAEIPSNVVLAEEFLEIFDGMSIGSNDLTQLVLGVDRDNARIAQIGDERNEAVKHMVSRVIKICRKKRKYSGICGQAPSDFPEFAKFLVEEGIESISLNPDTVIKTLLTLSKYGRST